MWQHLVCPNQHVPKHLYLIGYFSQQLFGTSRSLPLNRPPSLVKQAKKKSIKFCCKYVNTPMITKCPSAIPNKWVWCRWLNMCLCMCTKYACSGFTAFIVVWLQPARVAFTVDVAFLTVVTGKTRSGKENRLRCSSQFPIPRRDDQVSAYLRNEIYWHPNTSLNRLIFFLQLWIAAYLMLRSV